MDVDPLQSLLSISITLSMRWLSLSYPCRLHSKWRSEVRLIPFPGILITSDSGVEPLPQSSWAEVRQSQGTNRHQLPQTLCLKPNPTNSWSQSRTRSLGCSNSFPAFPAFRPVSPTCGKTGEMDLMEPWDPLDHPPRIEIRRQGRTRLF